MSVWPLHVPPLARAISRRDGEGAAIVGPSEVGTTALERRRGANEHAGGRRGRGHGDGGGRQDGGEAGGGRFGELVELLQQVGAALEKGSTWSIFRPSTS